MSYFWDRLERNVSPDTEEARDAERYSRGTCGPGRHDMRPDGRGGGVCACGETVDREEL